MFTGIASATLSSFAPSLASIVSGTIVAAAIINEIIAVVVAKFAFKWAGEIQDSTVPGGAAGGTDGESAQQHEEVHSDSGRNHGGGATFRGRRV